MRHLIIASSLAALLTLDARGQVTNPVFIPGKLAVLRAGDGIITIASGRQHPIFIEEYDPLLTNQASPILSLELPTNGPSALFVNAHAGSEGQGLTRSADRRYLAVTGYSGDLNSIPGTPSSATNSSGQGYLRGFGTIDANTNFDLVYASDDWFGLQPGITQNNPRGIATDGSNDFWGCGTIAGTQTGGFVETGTLYSDGGGSPFDVQSIVNSAYFMRIINGVLYMVAKDETGGAQNNGVYDFVDFPINGGALVPLPYAPGNVAHVLETNLFLNFGSTYANVIAFDMNLAGTIAYAADTTYGIVKFVNSGGTWTSPYIFSSTNLGTSAQPKGGTGCFGIAADFSGVNPVIYATTMEEGDGKNTCSNRLIAVVDSGNPSTNLVAQTLAVANGTNEVFRGVDFTPDLTPLITSQPAGLNTTTNELARFSVGVASAYTVTFQWQVNDTNIADNSNISGATNSTLTIAACEVTNSGNYTVIVSNQYGAVTSQVAALSVSTVPVLPFITNAVEYVTNFVANNQEFSVSPGGTPPFAYQWYFGTNQLVDDGVKYFGSTNAALYVSNLVIADSGNYSVAVSNQGGGISNLVAVLTVQYVLPSIPTIGQPSSVTNLLGQTTSLSVSSVDGTPPLAFQWYEGSIADPLSDINEFSGAETNTLAITGLNSSDATNYFCVVDNAGGSTTSQVASVTVIVPPALSFVAYSNQIYSQNFDSLPNPGSTPVNTVGGGGPVTIGGITYEVANPFDFAFPLYTDITGGASGGLGLAATMSGWYGECDGDTTASGAQLGASDGSQTTGGIISFGTLDSGDTNRALGLIATSTSGVTHFGLKLINSTTSNLNYVSLKYVGEYWKLGTHSKTLTIGYTVDPAGNSSTLSTNEIAAAELNTLSNLDVNFPIAPQVGPTNGTLAVNQTNILLSNMALTNAWLPGSALWLVWSINSDTGSGQGYAIDNFSFYASSTNTLTPPSAPLLGNVAFSTNAGLSFTFTNAPGNSTNFSVLATSDLTLPLNQWVNLGNPTELSLGTYQFIDAQATNNPYRFYTVTGP
jgi:Immunoglobulin I-set domain